MLIGTVTTLVGAGDRMNKRQEGYKLKKYKI